jgi:DNA-binding MarR family transcriptional regulator
MEDLLRRTCPDHNDSWRNGARRIRHQSQDADASKPSKGSTRTPPGTSTMALRIDRTTMVALLDDLEEKGYVARQRHPHDRRAFLVHPSDSGRLAKVDAVRILDEQQRRFLEPLTMAERRVLAGLLRRLHEGLPSGPA